MTCIGRYAEILCENEKGGFFPVDRLLSQTGQRVMAILTQRNQIVRRIIPFVDGEGFAFSVDVMDTEATSAIAKLACVLVTFQDLWVAVVAFSCRFVSFLSAAIVACRTWFAVVGIRWINWNAADSTKILYATAQNEMRAISLGLEIRSMFFVVTFLTSSSVWKRRIPATSSAKALFSHFSVPSFSRCKTCAASEIVRVTGTSTTGAETLGLTFPILSWSITFSGFVLVCTYLASTLLRSWWSLATSYTKPLVNAILSVLTHVFSSVRHVVSCFCLVYTRWRRMSNYGFLCEAKL